MTETTQTTGRLNAHTAKALLDEHQRSGLSFKAFCSSKDIPAHRLGYWRWRIRQLQRDQSTAPSAVNFIPITLPVERSAENTEAIFTLPSGIKLTVNANIDAQILSALLRAAKEAV